MAEVSSLNASTSMELQKQHEAARKIITQAATQRGIKFAAVNAIVAAAAVYTANQHWPAFRNRLGVSGKWALVVMTGLASFTFESEQTVTDAARNPEKYLRQLQGGEQVMVQKKSRLGVHHRLANHVYDHPYQTLATVGLPVVGGIFAYQNMNAAINTSQKIMHTRIYGQSAVVCMLLSSMAFHDYMAKRGRFKEADK